MEWGKHLPGTDWWKEKVGRVRSNISSMYRSNLMTKKTDKNGRTYYDYGSTGKEKATAALKTFGSAAKYLGQGAAKYAKRLPGHMVNEVTNIGKNLKEDVREASDKFKESARAAYLASRNAVYQYMNKALSNYNGAKTNANTPLGKAADKQMRDILEVWEKAKEGSVFDQINLAFQTTQYNAVAGVNKYLTKIGMNEKVDDFLKKLGIRK